MLLTEISKRSGIEPHGPYARWTLFIEKECIINSIRHKNRQVHTREQVAAVD